MLTMYGFWRSAASMRVRAALNLKGISFTEIMIDLDAGQQSEAAYSAVNVQSVVPTVILEDGTKLTQSLAILEYLEELHPHPPLLPDDPAGRARARSLALLWAADHHPLIVPRVRRYILGPMGLDEATRDAWLRHWLGEGIRIGEARLSGERQTGRFCHGDHLTIADLCLVSHVAVARVIGLDLTAAPTMSRVFDACQAIDAVARAMPLRQPGAPAAH